MSVPLSIMSIRALAFCLTISAGSAFAKDVIADANTFTVKIIAAISEDLFDRQPESYRHSVLPPEALYDLMVVSTGTRRMWPIRDVGPLTDAYSFTSDWDNQWLTGGLEADVIAEAHLDPDSVFAGVQRFADQRAARLQAQRAALDSLQETSR